jgi:hypothetical protein
MALDRILGQIADIARQITSVTRPSAPPPAYVPEVAEATSMPAASMALGSDDDDAPLPSDDEVLVTRAGDDALLVSWQLSERGVTRARKISDGDAAIEARLFIVTADRELGSRTLVRERTVGRAGEWLAADLPRGALITASVGLAAGGRFVSVAHCDRTAMA